MTKKQKQQHVTSLKEVVKAYGFSLDRWNNYKKDSIRIKFKKINLRIEKKSAYGWAKLLSAPYVRIQPDILKSILNKI